mmetsp:Transcript_69652/g.185787  ORF Transcript_69652/g.185787 Transcript_69652/m.185787 type:complete len:213 (+) Transcript_69652:966-1604(+)
MHGDTAQATYKAYRQQGPPAQVNRVAAAGYEQPGTFPMFLGPSLKEGDVVTAWLDLEGHTLSFACNGVVMGEPVRGVQGPVVPAISSTAATDVEVRIDNYRRWAPDTGWSRDFGEASAHDERELGLGAQQLLDAHAAFRRRSGTRGFVDIAELPPLLRGLGVGGTESDLLEISRRVDADGSGSLDMLELLQLLSELHRDGRWASRPATSAST